MSNSMQHNNGCQMAVIDTETTGLNPFYHEMIQLAILPLDSNLNPRKDVSPFYLELQIEHPERIDPAAMTVNRQELAKIGQRGFDRLAAQGMLEHWIDTLGLPYTGGGSRKRIIPIGHNYSFDEAFMKAWLGNDFYSEFFDGRFRDTMTIAAFHNDKDAFHAQKIRFNKLKLSWIANQFNIPYKDAHDALADCSITAQVYKAFCQEGLM